MGRTLEEIATEIHSCRKCGLCETRINAVPGTGDANARIMLIGEAPGRNEDEGGEPFIGAAGKYLDKLLDIAGIDRSQVFIANVLKCRPPKNRDPKRDEIKACADYLRQQIDAVNPDYVITLGNFSTRFVLDTKQGIAELHGQVHDINGVKIIPMYHPAASMYSPKKKPDMEADFAALGKLLEAKS